MNFARGIDLVYTHARAKPAVYTGIGAPLELLQVQVSRGVSRCNAVDMLISCHFQNNGDINLSEESMLGGL